MLVRQQLDYGIYVINQDGEGVFNRAKLMNVGFAEALKDYDYECFVFSDVDLVPMDDRNLYRCFESPRHLSVAIDKFNFQLPYNTIFGGVSSFSKQQFLTVNGYSNTYWGWGGEDDDMYKRIIFHGMSINRPDHMTGKYKMITHDRDDHNANNPERLDKLSHTQEPAPMDTLDPCPDHPQNLIGPFSVDFSHSWTWNEVRRKISTPLQDGGRHKPADCVSKHKVAIIIPYRNRHEHLKHLLFYLHPMLVRQQLDYGIYVINQDGEGVFNWAKLMNVGFAEALKDYDYECFVFSDVDLVPMDDRNLYRCFESPRHLSVTIDKFNFQLPYNTIFGGVSSFSKQQFLTVNGYSNTYWGWGG
ncbi:Beta-1,4-galactosyltransferase 1 [Takifugu flavidus]|uniref:Beta-1,4-galactosyltransferase n=1 Tax=Takifugu flavidus TaxID=433684 RepID=A0A5C6MF36_9TELE|nr:Beta-1,4-galactosyltransferase 1 [Takifugu flavidus]